MLNVSVEYLGDTVVLRCQGALVREEEGSLLCLALGHDGYDIVVDLAKVHSIDAAGGAALLALQAAGVYLRLQNPSGPVRDFLCRKGMDSLFEMFGSELPLETMAEAQAQLSPRAA